MLVYRHQLTDECSKGAHLEIETNKQSAVLSGGSICLK